MRRRVQIEADSKPRRAKKPLGRGRIRGRPYIDFRTPRSFHAVDLADVRELVRRLRGSERAGIADQIEEAIAVRKPFVPTAYEREAIVPVIRNWIIELGDAAKSGAADARSFGNEFSHFWADVFREFPD